MSAPLTRGDLEAWIEEGLDTIAALPSRDVPVLIYGYGVFGRDLFQHLSTHGAHVVGFADLRRAGERSAETGRPILAPDEIPPGHWVVQSINNPGFPVTGINRELEARGARLLNPLQALWWCDGQLLWTARPEHYRDHLDEILATGERLEAADRGLYAGIWHDRLSGRFDTLYRASPAPYFPPDLAALPRELDLVDCGAFDGDVARSALAGGRTIRRLVAFEPDLENFARLRSWISGTPELGEAIALPAAVGDANCTLSFAGGLATSSRLDPQGSHRVPCLRLDDVLPRFPVNYLKLDVEGAEAAVLRGAAGLIRRHRPCMAVSIYHRPEDLFDLPRQIDEIAPGYRFHLRAHAMAGIDTLLYALPDDRSV